MPGVRISKKRILEAIKDSFGEKMTIAKRLQCSRSTLDYKIEKDEDIRKAFEYERDEKPKQLIDSMKLVALTQLYNEAKRGNFNAVKFIMQHYVINEGNGQRFNVNLSGNFSIKDLDPTKLTDNQLTTLKQMITTGKTVDEISSYLKMANYSNE